MTLRTLNDAGLDAFNLYLDALKLDPTHVPPFHILFDDDYSQDVTPHVAIEKKVFDSRMTAATYLLEVLSKGSFHQVDREVGMWAWLSLFFFDQLCPAVAGLRKPRERAGYIPEPHNHQRYYRHLLLGPYMVLKAYQDSPDKALCLLSKPVNIIDDLVAQLASRQEIVTNRAAIELATRLYVDPLTRQPKKGAGNKGPGSSRRFAAVLGQFDLTWDLYIMKPEELLELLPSEFARFRS